MRFFPTLFLLLMLFSALATAQVKNQKAPTSKGKTALPVMNDFSVMIHEETLNKVFAAIGEITGTNDYSVMLIKGKYHWKIVNSRINLRPDSSDFTCDAKVTVGPFEYQTPVKGRVKIWYDKFEAILGQMKTTKIPLVPEACFYIYGKAAHHRSVFPNERNTRFFLSRYLHHFAPHAETLAFCILPTEYHFLIKTRTENEIISASKLPHNGNCSLILAQSFGKFLLSYTHAFNKETQGRGSIFMCPFRRMGVNENQVRHFQKKIHLLPFGRNSFLQNSTYPHSSLSHVLNFNNEIVQPSNILKLFGGMTYFRDFHRDFSDNMARAA